MKVVRDSSGEYGDCGYEYLDFEQHGDDSIDEVLFYGYASGRNKKLIEQHSSFDRKIFYQGEQPCGFYSLREKERLDSLYVGRNFDEVYTTCPYSAAWMNNLHNYDKYRTAIFPHNLKWAVQPDESPEKILDVIYWGNVPNDSKIVKNIIETIPKFKHNFFTLGLGMEQKYMDELAAKVGPFVTGVNVPRQLMWERLKYSKIMVTANLLYLSGREVEATKTLPRWQENRAFSHIDNYLMPQIKTRPIEAIFNKTLVLLKEDPWHIFDHWFEPGEEFLYYKEDEDLEPMIREISQNWQNYEHITQNAYNKAIKLYSSTELYNNMEKGQSEFKF